MRTNQNVASQYCPVFTKEGAPSTRVPPLQMLKRLTMACMLWEDSFYVDGKKHTEIIEEVCKKVKPEKIVQLAKDCHKKRSTTSCTPFSHCTGFKTESGMQRCYI